jgi:hypothetical protein
MLRFYSYSSSLRRAARNMVTNVYATLRLGSSDSRGFRSGATSGRNDEGRNCRGLLALHRVHTRQLSAHDVGRTRIYRQDKR